MIRQSKISIVFNQPVIGRDLQDGTEFLSNKHWVIAEVIVISQELMKFYDHQDELVAEWQSSDLESISIPVLDAESPVVKEQKSYEYQAVVKKERPAAWSAWTIDEEMALAENYEKGINLEELADIHNRTPNAIYERLWKIGIKPEERYGLGVRPQKRHYEKLGLWNGDFPNPGESKTVCLGCGNEIFLRPCECWKAKDTSGIRTWREHRNIYSTFGSVIGKRY